MANVLACVMGAVVTLEGLWLFAVWFLFGSRVPGGFFSLVAPWLMLVAALIFFWLQKRTPALLMSYVGTLAAFLLLGLGGGGPPHFHDSLYRNVPNGVFLIAAHLFYRRTAAKATS